MKDENRELIKDSVKDIIISVIVVAIIFLSLYGYTQNWPPIVIVESGSMQHGSLSHIGTIDTGDIILVKKIYSEDSVISYVEGRLNGYKKYGDYGDVIIYEYNGKLIIHRAIVYLIWDGDHWKIRGFENGKYPSWLIVTSSKIEIKDAEYAHKSIIINLSSLDPRRVGDEGFITMGDHNLAKYGSYAYDQNSERFIAICPKLVNYSMIKGVARGEIPWFGALKLYLTHTNLEEIPANTKRDLGISLLVIFVGSFLADYTISKRDKIRERMRKFLSH